VSKRQKEAGIMWQGRPSDIDEMYHLLQAFDVEIARHEQFLAIILPGAKQPMIMGLGDEVVLNEHDQMQIRQRTD